MSDTDAGRGTGSGVFPVDGGLHHWRLGFRQFSFHHIPRVLQHLASLRLDTTATFLACSGPLHLSDPGKPSDPRTSLRVLPSSAGDTTRRLVAHLSCRDPGALHGLTVVAVRPSHRPAPSQLCTREPAKKSERCDPDPAGRVGWGERHGGDNTRRTYCAEGPHFHERNIPRRARLTLNGRV